MKKISLQFIKNIQLSHLFWNEYWKQRLALLLVTAQWSFGSEIHTLTRARLARFLTMLKQLCINALKSISFHQEGALPPKKKTQTNKPNQTSTPKPDENLGKEMLNLGTHARICSWSHPYSQVNSNGESKPLQLQPGQPRARFGQAQSAPHNRADAELQEDPTVLTVVLQVSYLM